MPYRQFRRIQHRLQSFHALRFSTLLFTLLLSWSRTQATGQDNVPTVMAQQAAAQYTGQPSKVQSEQPNPDFSPKGPYQGPLEISHIARFDTLPMRMHFEPHMIAPTNSETLDPRYVPLFERTLRDIDDDELLETAALSLARVAEEKMQNIETTADILMKHLESHPNRRVRFACARALANADYMSAAAALLALDSQIDDAERLWIDPALARWKFAPAADVWKKRLTDDSQTAVAISLACEGLIALNDSQASESLRTVLNNRRLIYEKRFAAAKALSSISPETAFEESAKYIAGNVSERILAVQLLSSQNAESLTKLFALCADASDGVASAAWLAMYRLMPEGLLPALDSGRSHRDAVIRMTTARVMRQFPTQERTSWLHEQLNDKHLEVRNVAREMLVLVAQEQPTLRDSIVALAGDCIAADSENWQGIEQSLLLLGQLRGGQFSDRCIPLLEHSRNEVLVTAAWLLHLFPDATVEPAIRQHLTRNDEMLKAPATAPEGAYLGLQSAYLIQYAGLMRLKDLELFLQPNFKKTEPGGYEKRSAAMWTMGLLHENDPVPELTKSFIERLADRDSLLPEHWNVRRMSAVALGILRAKSAASGLIQAYEIDSIEGTIPDSARWSLGMIGEPMPEPTEGYLERIGGWKLNPLGD